MKWTTIIALLFAGAALVFAFMQYRKADIYREAAIRQATKVRLEADLKLKESEKRLKDLKVEAEAVEKLFQEYMQEANREHQLDEITEQYEEDLNTLHSLSPGELQELIEAGYY